jgi:hypothetical protein
LTSNWIDIVLIVAAGATLAVILILAGTAIRGVF